MKLSITHTRRRVKKKNVCVCACVRGRDSAREEKETVWEERRVCFTKRCRRLSCSPRHLTAFHLLLLLDQPRAAVTSSFPALTSHTPRRTSTHTDARPGDRRLTRLARTFWLASLGLCSGGAEKKGRGSARMTLQLTSQCLNMQNGRATDIHRQD